MVVEAVFEEIGVKHKARDGRARDARDAGAGRGARARARIALRDGAFAGGLEAQLRVGAVDASAGGARWGRPGGRRRSRLRLRPSVRPSVRPHVPFPRPRARVPCPRPLASARGSRHTLRPHKTRRWWRCSSLCSPTRPSSPRTRRRCRCATLPRTRACRRASSACTTSRPSTRCRCSRCGGGVRARGRERAGERAGETGGDVQAGARAGSVCAFEAACCDRERRRARSRSHTVTPVTPVTVVTLSPP
jgi:hypothetical protein